MIRIAVLGYGTVGSGVVKVIQTNAKIIAKRAGQEVEVKYVLDLRDFPDDPIQSKVVHDFNVILEDPEVDIVVETMGGTKPAYEFVKKSLLAGKSVCTSNKELEAAYFFFNWFILYHPYQHNKSCHRNSFIIIYS